MRAVPEEVELAVEENCEFLPFMQVTGASTDPVTGKVHMVTFCRSVQVCLFDLFDLFVCLFVCPAAVREHAAAQC